MVEVGRTFMAYDPGNATGWAYFISGRLVAGGDGDPWSVPMIPSLPAVVEMVIWRGKRERSTPEKLFRLCVRVGILQGRLGKPMLEIPPHEWKGQLPKITCHKRQAKILDPKELAVFEGLGPDGKDAVGLGLHALARRF